MKPKVVVLAILVFAIGFVHQARGEVPYWKIDEVKIGATGYGLTVFQGHEPEKFYFEIVGLEDTSEGPQFSVSVWKNINGKKKPFNIASGMSGSPLYINGRLVAAIAAGWDSVSKGSARPFQYMYEEAMRAERFRSLYQGIVRLPVNLAPDRRLIPGSSIKIGFITGDQDLSNYSMGTVTAVDEKTGTIFALGHPIKIFSRGNAPAGPVSCTAWEGSVADTVNEVGQKVPGWDTSRGQHARVWFNGVHGVYGTPNEVAEAIPLVLEVNLNGYHFRSNLEIPYGTATLGLSQAITGVFLDARLESLGEITTDFFGSIELEDGREVSITERFFHSVRDLEPFSAIFLKKTFFFGALSKLLNADSKIKFKTLNLSFRAGALGPVFVMRGATILNPEVYPGEKIRIAVQIVEEGRLGTSARRFEPIVEVVIPQNTPVVSNRLSAVIVETGESFIARRPELQIPPANFDDLIRQIVSDMGSNDSFYVTVLLPVEGGTGSINDQNLRWKEMTPGETIFKEFVFKGDYWSVLEPIRVTVPDPRGVIISKETPGRFEFAFQIKASPEDGFWTTARTAFWIVALAISFFVASFVSAKFHPLMDRLWGRISSIFRNQRTP